MRLRPVLALSVWLVVETIRPTSAQLPPRQTPEASPCDAPRGTAPADTPAGHALLATVTRVAPSQGQLEFTTEAGSFVLTTPAPMYDLRVGDQLVICLHEEMSEGKDRFAEEVPVALP